MTVAVITDSTAAIAAATAAEHGITVVPIMVTIGDTPHRDGELPLSELLLRIDQGVTTSGPSPGAFATALEGAGDGAVVVTVAGALSSTFGSATIAGRDYSGPLEVVDSGSAAGAQALVALHAARRAASGGTVAEVGEAARTAASRVRLVGVLDTLEFLVRSGRVPGLVGSIAGSLGVRALFELRDGRVHRLRPALGRASAMQRIVAAFRRSSNHGGIVHCAAVHAAAEEDAEHLLERVRATVEPATALVSGFGPGMVAHTGPGVVGLAWWWEDPGAERD
jgi:DegV family protein with EDD domain